MYKNRYITKEIDQTVHWDEGSEDPTITYDEGMEKPADIQDCLREMESGCWDSEDWRSDEVIFYPADSHQDMRTGDYESTTLVIKGSERHIHWLGTLYNLRRKNAHNHA